jgi:DNA-binding CsgD family transcriptional regulator
MDRPEIIISKQDALTLLEIIQDCLSCESPTDACNIMNKTRSLIDFDKAVYGLAKLDNNGNIMNFNTLNFSYPLEWLTIYRKNMFHKKDPIALENFSNFKLQYWADTYKKYEIDKEFYNTSQDFKLINGYATGITNQFRTEGCLLSFAGDLKDHPRHVYILNNLSPHLHSAFKRALFIEDKHKSLLRISIREKEVLCWVSQGKTTWDISQILEISERTVKFHVNNIMIKLDAVSRPQAVAIALTKGMIELG